MTLFLAVMTFHVFVSTLKSEMGTTTMITILEHLLSCFSGLGQFQSASINKFTFKEELALNPRVVDSEHQSVSQHFFEAL